MTVVDQSRLKEADPSEPVFPSGFQGKEKRPRLRRSAAYCNPALLNYFPHTPSGTVSMQEAFLEAVRAVSQDQLFNACGTVGGLLLAGAQIPQIYYVTTRQRARDVSYAYQVRKAAAAAAAGFGFFVRPSRTPAARSCTSSCLRYFRCYGPLRVGTRLASRRSI